LDYNDPDFDIVKRLIDDYKLGLDAVKKEKLQNDEIYRPPQSDPDEIAKLNSKPLSFFYQIEQPKYTPQQQE